MSLYVRILFRWLGIIGLLSGTLLLGGCSAVRLGYNNAPDLTYWWLDSYMDFDSSQSVRLRADLQTLQDWHRKEELPQYADFIRGLQPLVTKQVRPEQVCALYDAIEVRLLASAERMLPTAAVLAQGFSPAQLEHMQKTWEKHNQEWREDWLDGTPAERSRYRVKKFLERVESFYGRLGDAQVQQLQGMLNASPFDADTQYRDRLKRQLDTLQILRAARTTGTTETQVQDELRALLNRSVHSTVPAQKQYQERMRQYTCNLLATLHNSATPAQRSKLAQTLQNYEGDARALMAVR